VTKLPIQDAISVLAEIKGCQVKAGIQDHCFIAFGTLLGALRPTARTVGDRKVYMTGFMEHDDDMDIGVLDDRISKEEQTTYIRYLQEKNLFRAREKYQHRTDNNRLVWCSLRRSPAPRGAKCCHWFWQNWKGYYWHSKGADWADLGKNKFPLAKFPRQEDSEAVMLGVPQDWMGELVPIMFEGIEVNIPLYSGKCVDLWYPSWFTPKQGGASAKAIVATVGSWSDERTWKIIKS